MAQDGRHGGWNLVSVCNGHCLAGELRAFRFLLHRVASVGLDRPARAIARAGRTA